MCWARQPASQLPSQISSRTRPFPDGKQCPLASQVQVALLVSQFPDLSVDQAASPTPNRVTSPGVHFRPWTVSFVLLPPPLALPLTLTRWTSPGV